MVLVALLYIFLASSFFLAKEAVSYANPCFLIGFRMCIAGSILLGYFWLFKRKEFVIRRTDWGLFFRVSLFHIYLAFILEFWSLQYLSALKTTIIFSSTPFIGALLSFFILKERLSLKKIGGICLGLLGLLPVILAQTGAAEFAREFGHISLPEVVLMGAVISGAYAWFLVKKLIDRGYGLPLINGVAMLTGGILSFITAFFLEGFSQPVRAWSPFLFWIALLILVANVIVYNFYGWLLKRYSITFVMFAGWLCPVFATIFEWVFMGGAITWHYFVSLFLITAGLSVFYQEELKKEKIIKI